MLDTVSKNDLDKTLFPINDPYLQKLKDDWYTKSQKPIEHDAFINKASEWFRSTKINSLSGVDKFPCVDIIMGCTHYIESLVSKHSWNIQILPKDYAYYRVMGKQTTNPGDLKSNIPLIVSLPNWYYGDRPDWESVLKECEEKNIDIHVDCAWITVANDFNFNFDHPNIKSFAMSMSKYDMTWNRIGLRWSRQRTMDSCTVISAQRKYNELTTACGSFIMDNIERDYGWNKYGELNKKICEQLDVSQTKFVYVVKDKNNDCYSIGKILGDIKQVSPRH